LPPRSGSFAPRAVGVTVGTDADEVTPDGYFLMHGYLNRGGALTDDPRKTFICYAMNNRLFGTNVFQGNASKLHIEISNYSVAFMGGNTQSKAPPQSRAVAGNCFWPVFARYMAALEAAKTIRNSFARLGAFRYSPAVLKVLGPQDWAKGSKCRGDTGSSLPGNSIVVQLSQPLDVCSRRSEWAAARVAVVA
jgi:hypothetical protein